MSNVKAYLEDIVRDGLHDIAEALKGSSPAGDVQASHVIYDNTESGLTSNRVQGAIDELSTKVNTNTSGISDLGDDVSDLTTRVGAAEGDITALETWKSNLDAGDIPYNSGTVEDALDSSVPKTDIATVESGSTASRAYSVGELVYVNSNLYKVITAIASGATFTVGTNIQSTNASGALMDMTTPDGIHDAIPTTGITVLEYLRWWKIGKVVIVDIGGISTSTSGGNVLITQDIPIMRSRPTCVLRNDSAQDTALLYGILGTSQLRFSVGYSANRPYYGQLIYMTD